MLLFLACGWYAALGRVVNFEMCHLRSIRRVANLKNEGFRNGDIEFDFWRCQHVAHAVAWSSGGWGGVLTSFTNTPLSLRNMLPLLTCCTCCHMIIRGWGCVNVLDEYFPYVPEHVAVVNMLHMLSYDHQGGGGVYWRLLRILPFRYGTCCRCWS